MKTTVNSGSPSGSSHLPWLSAKPIPAAERLIFALDVASPADARRLVEQLGESVLFYKVGLELFLAGGSFDLVDWLVARGKKVFVDLKIFDVPSGGRSRTPPIPAGRQREFRPRSPGCSPAQRRPDRLHRTEEIFR